MMARRSKRNFYPSLPAVSTLPRDMPTSLPSDAGDSPKALGNEIRRGTWWSVGGTVVFRFSNIAVTAVVARILVPEEFGIFALAVAVHAFTVSIAELGVASAIPRVDLNLNRIAPTVTTISMATSLFFAALMAIFATPLASLLGTPESATVIRILSLCVAMIGPFAVPGAILQREFKQQMVFKATVGGFIPSACLLVWMVLNGAGAEGLAWSRVVSQLITGILMIAATKRFYKPGLDRSILTALLAFGVPLAFSNLMSQVLLNVDNIFIVKLLGVSALGTYTIAFGISTWATAAVGTTLNTMVLPSITAIVRDGGDLKAAVLSAVRLVSWVAAPIAVFSIIFAKPLVLTIYGQQWGAAAPVLAALAIYGMLFVLGLLFTNIIIATGRTGVLFWIQVAALVALLPALPLGIRLGGSVGAAMAHVAVVAIVTIPAYLFCLRKVTGVSSMAVLRKIMWPCVAAVIAAAVAWLATLALDAVQLKLLVGFGIFGCSYASLTLRQVHQVLPIRWLSFRKRKTDEAEVAK